MTLPLAEMDRQQDDARRGIPAVDPPLEVCFPTVHDPSLAPEGRHVATVGVRSQPYALAGDGWDAMRDRVADRVVEQLGRFFPDLPGMVVDREVLSPLDLEQRLGLTGGHHLHGDMLPDQLFMLRPVRGAASYRAPIRGLYLCGAGTHPGGGVTGANGRNCAGVVVGDLRRRRVRIGAWLSSAPARSRSWSRTSTTPRASPGRPTACSTPAARRGRSTR